MPHDSPEVETGFPMAVDSTIVSTYSSCPRKAELSYMEHWSPKQESVHLVAGAAYAKGLEVLRRTYWSPKLSTGGQWNTALQAGEAALISEWGDFEPPAGSKKTLASMIGALHYYAQQKSPGTDPFKPYWHGSPRQLAVEMSFAVPLPIDHPETGDPILYAGRFDQVVDFDGRILCLDDKTTSSLGASWAQQWHTRGQFMGYTWAMQQAGIDVRGAVVRGMMIGHTQKEGTYYRLAEEVVWHQQHLIDRWYKDLLVKIRRMVQDYKAGHFVHSFGDSCSAYGGCPFNSICLSADPDRWLGAAFERRPWSPLNEH